ncbi:hypothetical protein TNCV_3002971 [Trichonephila clavipes]|nr:hypothetical protein TNCV_3002971 [Trichonephila clavipes]
MHIHNMVCAQQTDTWCEYNRAITTGEVYKHKNTLPSEVLNYIKNVPKTPCQVLTCWQKVIPFQFASPQTLEENFALEITGAISPTGIKDLGNSRQDVSFSIRTVQTDFHFNQKRQSRFGFHDTPNVFVSVKVAKL